MSWPDDGRQLTHVNKESHYGEPVREFLLILYETSVRTTQREETVPIRRINWLKL
jgi:hypothetical protein